MVPGRLWTTRRTVRWRQTATSSTSDSSPHTSGPSLEPRDSPHPEFWCASKVCKKSLNFGLTHATQGRIDKPHYGGPLQLLEGSWLMRRRSGPLFLLGCLLLVPTLARAQATLAGVVRDASEAVLPGVTVEVSSPAMIEKTRTAITDGTGQYRLTQLPPGTYSMTATLTGFTTVKR